MSTGLRVLLRRHVLQYDRADESDKRCGHEHAQEPRGPDRRAEDEIGRRRAARSADCRVTRVVVFDVVDNFSMLEIVHNRTQVITTVTTGRLPK